MPKPRLLPPLDPATVAPDMSAGPTESSRLPPLGLAATVPASDPPTGDEEREAAVPLRRRSRDLFLVDLDAFFVSVERRNDSSLEGRPVIVGGLPGERGVVACASYEARACGARAAMPIGEAAALCPPDTVFLRGDFPAYLEASRQVMEILRRFAPAVEPLSLDEALLDLTGCERHHRSWLAAAEALRRAVRDETGLAVSVGIGGTRAVASIAAGLAKPSGVLEVARGEEAAFLAALPLEFLPGVGPATRRRLARFNLHAIGDLARIPEETMAETFGLLGVALSRRARGIESPDDEIPVGERRPKSRSISRVVSFAQDTADPATIDAALLDLAQRAARALRRERSLVRSVGVRLRYSDFHTVEARRRLPEPTDRDAAVERTVRDLWPSQWKRRMRLRLVGVVLHDLVPAGDRQLDLFAPPRREMSGLDAAVDRIRDRHGFGAILPARSIPPRAAPGRTARGA